MIAINPERLHKEFIQLLKIDSPTLYEGAISIYLQRKLSALNCEILVDDTGEKLGGQSGNIIARLKGNTKDIAPIFFSAHMDNVEPCREVKPTIAGGIVRSAGDTVLGADDKAGIAAILEMLTVVKENDIPHGDIEILFDVAEETGLRGVKHLNLSHFRSPFGYCLDGDVVEEAVLRAPASYRITYRIKGHAAHAGVFPEKGINAIALASQAISRMKLGRIDEETTANVGIIHGGIATNIVPSEVVINAEARSRNETKLLKQVEAMHSAFTDILDQYTIVVEGKTITPSLEEERKLDYPAMNLDHTEPVFTLAAKAAQNIGLNLKATVTGGGSDANFLNCGGMKVAVLGHGVKNLHTTKEYIALEDLEKCANLITQIVLEHAKFGTV